MPHSEPSELPQHLPKTLRVLGLLLPVPGSWQGSQAGTAAREFSFVLIVSSPHPSTDQKTK